MQTVVLAAGEGTRMRPLTATRPKPMLPVAGYPLLHHVLDTAVDAGARRFVIVVGYAAETIQNHFGNSFRGVPLQYAEQTTQDGTADAVLAARPHLEDAPFVVLAGDNLYDTETLQELFEGAPAVGAYRVDDPRPYGVFAVDGSHVTSVIEKPTDPPSNLVNTSAYAFEATALEWLTVPESDRGEHELTDVLARQINEGNVRLLTFDRWLDVGRPWELLEANEWKLAEVDRQLDGTVAAAAEIIGDVTVEAGATIRSGAVIEGPVLVQAGASVGPNAYVRGRSVVGKDAHVGHSVEIKNTILMAGASAGHLSYVGDSVIGRDTNLGAGTITANLRHDDEPVKLTVKGERVSTGRRKFGVVLGDGAKTGINTSLNAGVTLTTDAKTGLGEIVTRDI